LGFVVVPGSTLEEFYYCMIATSSAQGWSFKLDAAGFALVL
jgi:hypothetical protein